MPMPWCKQITMSSRYGMQMRVMERQGEWMGSEEARLAGGAVFAATNEPEMTPA